MSSRVEGIESPHTSRLLEYGSSRGEAAASIISQVKLASGQRLYQPLNAMVSIALAARRGKLANVNATKP